MGCARVCPQARAALNPSHAALPIPNPRADACLLCRTHRRNSKYKPSVPGLNSRGKADNPVGNSPTAGSARAPRQTEKAQPAGGRHQVEDGAGVAHSRTPSSRSLPRNEAASSVRSIPAIPVITYFLSVLKRTTARGAAARGAACLLAPRLFLCARALTISAGPILCGRHSHEERE